jgi:hypothetical protein
LALKGKLNNKDVKPGCLQRPLFTEPPLLISFPSLQQIPEITNLRKKRAGCQWLTPVILATQEAEIRRITVRRKPRQIVCKTLSQKSLHKKGLKE